MTLKSTRISDNELAKCLLHKVHEALGYEGYTFNIDNDGNTFVGDVFVSSSPKIAAFVVAAKYLIQEQPFEETPVPLKDKKGIAGRIARVAQNSKIQDQKIVRKPEKEL